MNTEKYSNTLLTKSGIAGIAHYKAHSPWQPTTTRHQPQVTVRRWAGRHLDQGGGGGGVGTEGESELHVMGARGTPAGWTVGGAEAKYGGSGGGGVGTEGEPELRVLGAKGKPKV